WSEARPLSGVEGSSPGLLDGLVERVDRITADPALGVAQVSAIERPGGRQPGGEQAAERRVELDRILGHWWAEQDVSESRSLEPFDDLLGRLTVLPQPGPPPVCQFH